MNRSLAGKYIAAICNLIEVINKAELTKHGNKVILNYLDECPEPDYSEKARYAINKYICKRIPSLESIREKNNSGRKLDKIDHLILKMEYEADKMNRSA